MLLLSFLLIPAAAGFLIAFLPRNSFSRWVIAVPAVLFLLVLTSGEIPTQVISWIPSLGVDLALAMDGLGSWFALIITGVGTLVLLYAAGYFEDPAKYVRFASYTLLFMAAMLGIVLSANLLLLFVFWELTSVTSYLLIGFYHEREEARDGARRALIVTGGGGLAMLAGVILIGVTVGSFDLETILANGEQIKASAVYAPAVILILIGAFAKSAQYPLHFWLPGAMEAPTPASAYLHSATMVKAGIFLLARLYPAIGDTPLFNGTVTAVGLFTAVYASIYALRQSDLKAILAYSTVSWLGTLTFLIGLGTKDSIKAAIVGVLAHALYKGALFLTAGSIDHAAGTRDIERIGGLGRVMRFTLIGAVIAGISMAGIPPLFGFLAKETLLVGALEFDPIITALVIVSAIFTTLAALRILWDSFAGSIPEDIPHKPHEVSPIMWSAPLIMGAVTLILPFTLTVIDRPVSAAVESIRRVPSEIHLHLFEGINTPFILSMIAITAGIVLFALRRPLINLLRRIPGLNTSSIYDAVIGRALPGGALFLTDIVQNGKLRNYISIIVASFVGLMLTLLIIIDNEILGASDLAGADIQTALICILLIVAALATVLAPTRLAAIAALGIEGALVSLLFAVFGAPDLAFTQLMIEVVSLILFVLAFHFLPDTFSTRASRIRQLRDLTLASLVGVIMAALVLMADGNRLFPSISPWYVENSIPRGQGANIVNVIVIDFRGMDTQGEILVLVIAAMGVVGLLRLRPVDQPRGQYLETDTVSNQVDDAEPSLPIEWLEGNSEEEPNS